VTLSSGDSSLNVNEVRLMNPLLGKLSSGTGLLLALAQPVAASDFIDDMPTLAQDPKRAGAMIREKPAEEFSWDGYYAERFKSRLHVAQ
jgi:hypothetical protein